MSEWKHTSCVLCAQNCGLEMEVEDGRIIKVRGDKSNPRSQGYCCRKGLSLASYEHNADRLGYPLKKVGDHHERISWEQAICEISEKLLALKEQYSGSAISYMGGGAIGGQMECAVGLKLLNSLGSRNYYSSLAQEFSNVYWVDGRITGRQGSASQPDTHKADTVIAWGWNGWMSNQEPQARTLILNLEKDPNKHFIVIDPRVSESAEHAEIHLKLKPGSDTMLAKAMIKIVLDNGWENSEFIAEHVSGWEETKRFFDGFDAKRAVTEICGLDYDKVVEVTRIMATTKSCIHQDLGIYMNRNSTINNFLIFILRCITGRMCVEGGQVIPAMLYAMGSHTDERNPKITRTAKNGMFPVCGVFPPVLFPDEVLGENVDRIRAVIVSACNPLRSYPDTKAYEKAFRALDLSVCIDVAYNETARECDYVLPCKSYMETYDTVCFNYMFPDLYFQMRQPVLPPFSDECKEGSQIMVELMDKMDFIPEIPQSVYDAAKDSITSYCMELMMWLQEHMEHARMLPAIVAKSLGPALGSYNEAMIVALLMGAGKAFKAGATAVGYPDGDDFSFTETVFEDIKKHPEGMILATFQCENFRLLKTEDKKLCLRIEELDEQMKNATIENEQKALAPNPDFPMFLHAGLHHETVMNTMLRDPAWNKGRDADNMFMNEADAKRLGINNGDIVRITTKVGSADVKVEIDSHTCENFVYIRHGRGMIYNGVKYGTNVNELVSSADCDEMYTPMHRRVPCKVEKI